MRRQVTTEEIESVDRVMEPIGVVLVVAPLNSDLDYDKRCSARNISKISRTIMIRLMRMSHLILSNIPQIELQVFLEPSFPMSLLCF